MSRTATAVWKRVVAEVRKRGRERGLPCHLCRGALGPIDYRTQAEADKEAKAQGAWWLIGAPRPLALSVDHIRPHAAGGTDTLDNAAPSHAVCNSRAGAKGTTRPAKPQPIVGHWEPLDTNGARYPGRAIPGTRTPTHIFQA